MENIVKGGEINDMLKLLRVKEACTLLGGISTPMLYRLVNEGKIIKTKIGGRTFFEQRLLEDYARRCRVSPGIR